MKEKQKGKYTPPSLRSLTLAHIQVAKVLWEVRIYLSYVYTRWRSVSVAEEMLDWEK